MLKLVEDNIRVVAIKEACMRARVLNPDLRVFEVSAKTGAGMDDFASWFLEKMGR